MLQLLRSYNPGYADPRALSRAADLLCDDVVFNRLVFGGGVAAPLRRVVLDFDSVARQLIRGPQSEVARRD